MTRIKVLLSGDHDVGTTTLRNKLCETVSSREYRRTLGIDIGTKCIHIGSEKLGIALWNMSIEDKFGIVRRNYIEGCWGAVIVFDITKIASFNQARNSINEIWGYNGKGVIPIVLVANKIDLLYLHARAISSAFGKAISKKLSTITSTYDFECPYIEVSGKTGKNVNKIFDLLLLNILRYMISLKRANKLSLAMQGRKIISEKEKIKYTYAKWV